MILIADSGSTKTDWCLAEEGRAIRSLRTSGTNPFFQSREEIADILRADVWPAVRGERVEAVYFYGAGCAFPAQTQLLREVLQPYFPGRIEVYSDLMAAARALCGHQAGIACILGTGSNSCLYDGAEIVEQVSPLGFILGDEGSGADLGKRLVGDCLKHQLPEPLAREFLTQYELTPAIILDRVYKQPFPNRFLAGLSRFLHEHLSDRPIYELVYASFRCFFIRNILPYSGHETYPVHFVGSIAYHYQTVLRAAAPLGIAIGAIRPAPMDGLIRFHSLTPAPDK